MPDATHVERLPLFSLGTLPEDGREPRARWIDVPDGRAPALLARRDFAWKVELPADDQSTGATLLTAYGFAGGDESPATRAEFRVRFAGRVIFSEDVKAGPHLSVHPLRLELPKVASGPGKSELVLEVELSTSPGAPARRNRRRAVWIDPVVERRHSVPGRRVSAAGALPEQLNLLLVTADTTRLDDLGVFGGPAPTPHLETLATSGVRFTGAFSAAFGTAPSHASLLAAVPALQHGVYDNATVLASRHTTLAEVLHTAGYRTGAFVGARPLARELGFAQGFDLYDDVLVEDPASGLGELSRFERRAEVVVNRFLAWLDAKTAERSGVENATEVAPFFAWLHFFDPHQPYAPAAGPPVVSPSLTTGDNHSAAAHRSEAAHRLSAHFLNARGTPKLFVANTALRAKPRLLKRLDAEARRRYRAEITELDHQLGRVLKRLRATGRLESTVVAFVADHGENFLDRGPTMSFGHSGLHGEVTRLPLVLHLPGAARPILGSTHDFLLANLDLAPTLLDALGVSPPSGWIGRSFLPALESSSKRGFRPHVTLESAHRREVAVRTERYLVRVLRNEHRSDPAILDLLGYTTGRPIEVYDLHEDPEERRALADIPEAAQRLVGLAEAVLASDPTATEALDGEHHREALEALGYLD